MGFNKINRYTNCDKHRLQWRLWLDTVTLLSGPVTKMYCVRACFRLRAVADCEAVRWQHGGSVSRSVCVFGGFPCATLYVQILCVTLDVQFLCATLYIQFICATLCVQFLCHTVRTVPLCHAVHTVPLCHAVNIFPGVTLYLQPYDGSIFEPKNVMR